MIILKRGEGEAIIYERGAYLYSWTINNKDVILRGNLDIPTRGGMAIMIPFANRVRNARYVFDGIEYVLPRKWWPPYEEHAIHGLVLDKEFSVKEQGDDYVLLNYVLNHTGYPTTLDISIKYSLHEDALVVDFLINNIGRFRAPLVVGAHPYFVVSNDWLIRTGESYWCEAIDKIPTGKLIRRELTKGDWDDCFLVDDPIELVSSYSSIIITRNNMKYLQIYTGIAGAVALEPMTGAPDAFNNGMGLVIINPGGNVKFSFTIKVLSI